MHVFTQTQVSVPFRGSILLNLNMIQLPDIVIEFPSPFGDLSYLTILKRRKVFIMAVSVPFRGSILLNQDIKFANGDIVVVSVPFRGSILLNFKYSWKTCSKDYKVSVPFRGSILLNCI